MRSFAVKAGSPELVEYGAPKIGLFLQEVFARGQVFRLTLTKVAIIKVKGNGVCLPCYGKLP
jgi:hypothetical protein